MKSVLNALKVDVENKLMVCSTQLRHPWTSHAAEFLGALLLWRSRPCCYSFTSFDNSQAVGLLDVVHAHALLSFHHNPQLLRCSTTRFRCRLLPAHALQSMQRLGGPAVAGAGRRPRRAGRARRQAHDSPCDACARAGESFWPRTTVPNHTKQHGRAGGLKK